MLLRRRWAHARRRDLAEAHHPPGVLGAPVPIQVFLYAALVVGAVGICAWAMRGVTADIPADAPGCGPTSARASRPHRTCARSCSPSRPGSASVCPRSSKSRGPRPQGDARRSARRARAAPELRRPRRQVDPRAAARHQGDARRSPACCSGCCVFLPNPSMPTFLLGVHLRRRRVLRHRRGHEHEGPGAPGRDRAGVPEHGRPDHDLRRGRARARRRHRPRGARPVPVRWPRSSSGCCRTCRPA